MMFFFPLAESAESAVEVSGMSEGRVPRLMCVVVWAASEHVLPNGPRSLTTHTEHFMTLRLNGRHGVCCNL